MASVKQISVWHDCEAEMCQQQIQTGTALFTKTWLNILLKEEGIQN